MYGHIAEFRRRFADSFQTALHRIVDHPVFPKGRDIHALCVAENRLGIIDDVL